MTSLTMRVAKIKGNLIIATSMAAGGLYSSLNIVDTMSMVSIISLCWDQCRNYLSTACMFNITLPIKINCT
jgi:hypothetical protein